MRAFVKIAAAAIAAALIPCQRSNADLKLLTIRAPEHCPAGLTIKSKADGGMTAFDISVDAEQIAHAGELYKGRVRAQAYLKIATSDEQIARVRVHEATDGQQTRFQFRISPSAAKTSELQLGLSLYEQDGRPTFGGGVSMQIHLAGFEPKVEQTDEAKAKP
jgi:hypothetical protein